MRRLVLFSMTILAAGCGPLDAGETAEPVEVATSAIRGGQVDHGHPAVVLIYNSAQGYICSGTLIDDKTVLTAAHCVEDSRAHRYDIAGGTDPFSGADWVVGATQVEMHPDYDRFDIGVRDVGIILLDEKPPVQPIPWQREADAEVYDVGTDVVAVGYGVTSESSNDSGVKRHVTLRIEDVVADAYAYGGPTKNICSGDSGGPDLVQKNGKDVVIGVHSFGDVNCSSFGASMRTDYNAEFIGQYVTAKKGSSGGPFEEIGCSVSGVSGRPGLGLLALLALVILRRR